MFVLELTLVLAAVFVLAAMLAFRWAVRDGQLDDLDTPALRILGDDSRKKVRNTAASAPVDVPRERGPGGSPEVAER